MSGSKVELRCDMLEIVEEDVREVMPIDAGASGLRWNVAEWLYSEWRLPKIDNARPFGDLELAQIVVTTVNMIYRICVRLTRLRLFEREEVLMMRSSESDGEVRIKGDLMEERQKEHSALKPGREGKVCEGEGVKGTPDAGRGAVHRRDSRLRLSEFQGLGCDSLH